MSINQFSGPIPGCSCSSCQIIAAKLIFDAELGLFKAAIETAHAEVSSASLTIAASDTNDNAATKASVAVFKTATRSISNARASIETAVEQLRATIRKENES